MNRNKLSLTVIAVLCLAVIFFVLRMIGCTPQNGKEDNKKAEETTETTQNTENGNQETTVSGTGSESDDSGAAVQSGENFSGKEENSGSNDNEDNNSSSSENNTGSNTGNNTNSKTDVSGDSKDEEVTEPEIIENEGDLEIVIPEGEETYGE